MAETGAFPKVSVLANFSRSVIDHFGRVTSKLRLPAPDESGRSAPSNRAGFCVAVLQA